MLLLPTFWQHFFCSGIQRDLWLGKCQHETVWSWEIKGTYDIYFDMLTKWYTIDSLSKKLIKWKTSLYFNVSWPWSNFLLRATWLFVFHLINYIMQTTSFGFLELLAKFDRVLQDHLQTDEIHAYYLEKANSKWAHFLNGK